jgi:hypothetical protein
MHEFQRAEVRHRSAAVPGDCAGWRLAAPCVDRRASRIDSLSLRPYRSRLQAARVSMRCRLLPLRRVALLEVSHSHPLKRDLRTAHGLEPANEYYANYLGGNWPLR